MLPLAIGALWSLYRWYQRRGDRYLVLASLLLGLGVTTKLLFFWYWIGLGLAWLALSPFLQSEHGWHAWLWPWRLTTWSVRGVSLLALLLGLSPLLIYNLDGLNTLQFVIDTFTKESSRNSGLFADMPGVMRRDFGRFLDSSSLGSRLGGASYTDRLAAPAFLAALATLVALAVGGKLSYSVRKLALLAILLFSLVAQSALTTMGQGADHVLIAWPIPQALISAAIFALVDLARARRWQVVLLGLLATCILGSGALTTAQDHRSLAQSGGQGFFSDAIYTLANDLEQAEQPRIAALDWGFTRNLQLLTRGHLKIEEWFTYTSQPGEEIEALLDKLVVQPRPAVPRSCPSHHGFPRIPRAVRQDGISPRADPGAVEKLQPAGRHARLRCLQP